MLSGWLSGDARAVRRVMAGRTDSFEPLVRRYYPAVRSVALAHTHNYADADDITQQVFLSAYESLGSLRDANQFKSWLMTIARNASTTRRKMNGVVC